MPTTTNPTIDPSTRRPIEGAKNRTEGHLWLHRMVGEWTYEGGGTMPDGSIEKSSGTESVRKLGEYWVVADTRGTMPDDDSEFHMVISLGYDIKKGKFVGSWVGSMMETLWVYDGHMGEDGTLNLDSEGEDMSDDTKTATYRDTIRFESDDVRVHASLYQNASGEWAPFMSLRYTRVK